MNYTNQLRPFEVTFAHQDIRIIDRDIDTNKIIQTESISKSNDSLLGKCVHQHGIKSESRRQIQKTLLSLKKSVEKLMETGLRWMQIGVVVIYDGFDKLNASTRIDESVLHMFKDMERENQDSMNLLQTQYNQYMDKKAILNYRGQNMPKRMQEQLMSDMRLLFIDKNSNDPDLIIQFNNASESQKNRMLEREFKAIQLNRIKANFLLRIRTQAQEWFKEKKQNAIIYQQLQNYARSKLIVFHCVNHLSRGRLYSHKLFFQKFCPHIKPEVVVLLNCGIKPQPQALMRFYQAIKSNQNIGGVCGLRKVRISNNKNAEGDLIDLPLGTDLFTRSLLRIFDVQQAQNFESLMMSIKDKMFQSGTGYIQNLSSEFSAYKYSILQDNVVLNNYFKSLDQSLNSQLNSDTINLAEFKLCGFQLFTKRDAELFLAYLPDAIADTDSILSLKQLLEERKYTIRDNYFDIQNAFENMGKISETKHSFLSRFLFCMNLFFTKFFSLIQYIGPSMYFFIIYAILNLSVKQLSKTGVIAETNLQIVSFLVYFGLVLLYGGVVLESCISNKKTIKYQIFYTFCSYAGVLNLFCLAMLTFYVAQGLTITITDSISFQNRLKAIFSIESAVFFLFYVYFVLIHSLFTCNLKLLFQCIITAIQYLFYLPTFFIMLPTYAFSQIDDLSNRCGSVAKQLSESLKQKKVSFFFRWLVTNILIALIFLSLAITERSIVLIFMVVEGLIILKFSIQLLFATPVMLLAKKRAQDQHQRTFSQLTTDDKCSQFIKKFSNYQQDQLL